MTIEASTVFTDWSWADDARPELRVGKLESSGAYAATLLIAQHPDDPIMELSGSPENLADQLTGYAELFAAAAEHLKKETPNDSN